MTRTLLLPLLLALATGLHGAPLHGTLTVGGASPHFATLPEAVTALLAEGIDGPVVLNVRPGVYETHWHVPDVPGASATNTITIQGETGQAADVEFRYTSIDPASSALAVAQISGDWVTLQYVTLRQVTGWTSTYGRVLEVTGDVNHVTVRHCRLIGTTAFTTIQDRFAVLFNWKTSTYAADDILIENNEILNGSVGVYWGGSSLSQGSGLRLRNNTIEGWSLRGVQVVTEPDAEITDNTITTPSTTSTYPYGILLEQCDGAVRVERNTVSVPRYIGIGVRDGLATAAAPAVLANNLVRVGSPSTAGIDVHESNFQDVLHNTVLTEGQFPSAVALGFYYGSGNRVVNNVLQDRGLGSCLRSTFPAADLALCNGNLYASPGGATLISSTFTTHDLAGWQALFGHDAASIADSAWFAGTDDLHLLPGSPGIDAALPGWVSDDVDGAPRPAQPDMGADEQGAEACAFSVAVVDAACPGGGGSIDLTLVSGTPPFAFAWSDGAATEDRADLDAGSYVVTATGPACTWTDTIAVGCLPPPPPLDLTLTGTGASCHGACDASIHATAVGGTPPFQFWIRRPGTGWTPTTAVMEERCPGPALVAVRDAVGAIDTAYVFLPEPARLKPFLVAIEPVSCFGLADGSIHVGATGGTLPYQWSRNGGITYQDTGYFDGLPAGLYAMRLEDANGCDVSGNLPLPAPDPLLLTVANLQNESAPGANDGLIEVAATGGTGDVEYRIDGGGWQSSPVFAGLAGGTYTVEAGDENDCVTALNATVGTGALRANAPAPRLWPNPAVGSARLTWSGTATAVRLLDATGREWQAWAAPVPPLTLDLGGLPAGAYRVLIHDATGLTTLPLTVAVP